MAKKKKDRRQQDQGPPEGQPERRQHKQKQGELNSSKASESKNKEAEKKPTPPPTPPKITLHITLERSVFTVIQRSRNLKESDFWEWFDTISSDEQLKFRQLVEENSNPDQARSLVLGKIAAHHRSKK